MGEDGDGIARAVQQRCGGQVNGVEGFEFPGQGAGPLNDGGVDLKKFDSAYELVDEADLEAITVRCPRHLHLKKTGRGEFVACPGLHNEPCRLISAGLSQ